MNVTVKLPDELCRRARHRAVDESKSLSAWLADLVRRELEGPQRTVSEGKSLADIMILEDAPGSYYEKELPLEHRKSGAVRDVSFEE